MIWNHGWSLSDSNYLICFLFGKWQAWMFFWYPSSHRKNVETTSHMKPHLSLDLKSGWDDMLQGRSLAKHSRSTTTLTSKSVSTPPSSPPSSPPPEEDTFVASTLNYLDSPVARSLGLRSPLLSRPSRIYATCSPNKVFIEKPSSLEAALPHQSIPEDAVSTISSIVDCPWPLPPSSAPPSSVCSRSSVYSEDSIIHPASRPFQNSLRVTSPGKRRSRSKWPSISSLRRNMSEKSSVGEVVYMTVVQETVWLDIRV